MTTTNRADESLGGDETKKFSFVLSSGLRTSKTDLQRFNKLVKLLLREKKKASGWYKVEVSIVGPKYPTAQKQS